MSSNVNDVQNLRFKVLKIPKHTCVWSVTIQEEISFNKDIYVKITNSVPSMNVAFGVIVESNLYGAIEKSEISFSLALVDPIEVYCSVSEFNDSMTKSFYSFFPL